MVGDVAQPARKDAAARGLSRRRLYRDPARRRQECAVQADEVRRGAPHGHSIRHHPRKRMIQYSRALVMESKSCGVLDTPLSRSMTPTRRAAECATVRAVS